MEGVFMLTYNKLVRDRIPEIIERSGKAYTTRRLNKAEYKIEINRKMGEELTEYKETTKKEDALEELSDMLELIYAAAAYHGSTVEELEEVRIVKRNNRGGFNDRIYLIDVEDD